MINYLVWSSEAEYDFSNILNYLSSHWGNSVALAFLNKLDKQINLISTFPKSFPLVNKDLNLRKSVLTAHNTIYYKFENNTIQIVRILDTRQDPQKQINN